MAKRTRRSFTPEFKVQIVLSILTGVQSQAEVCRQHGLKPELIALWKRTLLDRLPLVFAGSSVDNVVPTRVAELERLVGRLTRELEVAKKASAMLPSVLASGGRL